MPPKGVQMVLSSRFLFFATHLDQGQVRNFPPTFLVPVHQDGANDTPTLTLAPRFALLAGFVVVIYIRIEPNTFQSCLPSCERVDRGPCLGYPELRMGPTNTLRKEKVKISNPVWHSGQNRATCPENN